jgi:nitrogenase molybdenum-iron protein alpha/beta subunit
MSEDIRKMIDKVKSLKQFVNENINSNKSIVYHGGRLNNGNIDDLLYVSFDKEQASEYAKGNTGSIHAFELNMENIIPEDEARSILVKNNFQSKEEGWDLENELNLYEILDSNFSTSLADDDLRKYFNILKSNGVTGIQFTDMDIKTLKNGIQNILIIDKSALVNTTPNYAR